MVTFIVDKPDIYHWGHTRLWVYTFASSWWM